jgi:hypothetical protein
MSDEDRQAAPCASSPLRPEQTAAHSAKELHPGWSDRAGDTAFRLLARLGVGPASVLTTTGRSTGREDAATFHNTG